MAIGDGDMAEENQYQATLQETQSELNTTGSFQDETWADIVTEEMFSTEDNFQEEAVNQIVGNRIDALNAASSETGVAINLSEYIGTALKNVLGGGENDTLIGNSADNFLFGGNGNDVLMGGAGNDLIMGGQGDDTLIGGDGDDVLTGGSGNDTYVLNKGWGVDVITFDPSNQNDKIVFGEGINQEDLVVEMSGNDCIIRSNDYKDRVIIENWSAARLASIEMSDGSTKIMDEISGLEASSDEIKWRTGDDNPGRGTHEFIAAWAISLVEKNIDEQMKYTYASGNTDLQEVLERRRNFLDNYGNQIIHGSRQEDALPESSRNFYGNHYYNLSKSSAWGWSVDQSKIGDMNSITTRLRIFTQPEILFFVTVNGNEYDNAAEMFNEKYSKAIRFFPSRYLAPEYLGYAVHFISDLSTPVHVQASTKSVVDAALQLPKHSAYETYVAYHLNQVKPEQMGIPSKSLLSFAPGQLMTGLEIYAREVANKTNENCGNVDFFSVFLNLIGGSYLNITNSLWDITNKCLNEAIYCSADVIDSFLRTVIPDNSGSSDNADIDPNRWYNQFKTLYDENGSRPPINPGNDSDSSSNQPIPLHSRIDNYLKAIVNNHRDPIILDLDGDGTETVQLSSGVYFDLDANGYAEKTGWVKPDDGLLVLDRNGDGIINNGRELFGDQTRLNDGTIASSGFQALAAVDANGDGKIDQNDPVYSQLRVWRDVNMDGESQPNELFTLSEAGISALNIDNNLVNLLGTDGNIKTRNGSYEMSGNDGSLVTRELGEYLFNRDPEDSFFLNNQFYLDISILELPNLKGWGTAPDLYQAMASDASGELKGLVKMFIQEEDPVIRNQLLDQIIFKWTGCDTIDPTEFGVEYDARQLAALETISGTSLHDSAQSYVPARVTKFYNELREYYYVRLMSSTHCFDLLQNIQYSMKEDARNQQVVYLSDMSMVRDTIQEALLVNYEQGKTTLCEFVRTLRGLGYIQNLTDFGSFRDYFAKQSEELAWVIDTAGRDNQIYGTDGNDVISTWSAVGNMGNDVAIAGGSGNDSIDGAWSNLEQVLYGEQCNDTLVGGNQNDILSGGNDNDVISGGDGQDTLLGGSGQDILNGGIGNDILNGGTGNDYLIGGAGNDVYIYDKGYGNDVIDSTVTVASNNDTVSFGPGITANDIIWLRDDHSLVAKIQSTGETLTLKDWYLPNGDHVGQFSFTNDAVLMDVDVPVVNLTTAFGTTANDMLYGNAGKDNEIYGLDGNDTLYGYNGNDLLYGGNDDDYISGGAGDDVLFGGDGQDTLTSGAGNDVLVGGPGNDTYLYGRGHGNDVIDNSVSGMPYVEFDVIRFAEDITSNDIEWCRDFRIDGQSLRATIKDSGETLTIKNWFYDNFGHKVRTFQFADGSSLNYDVVMNKMNVFGTGSNDILDGDYGSVDYNDEMCGLDGNDTLAGHGGNDTLDGGSGNDYLFGASGNDIYVFGRGYGNDTVVNRLDGYSDIVQLGTGITGNDLVVHRNAGDLVLAIKDTTETLTFADWFLNNNTVGTIRFADGMELSGDQIESRQQTTGTDGDDVMFAARLATKIYGLAGNDSLIGDAEADMLSGGAGNDVLRGNGGNDTLDGGADDDRLEGGCQNDLLLGGSGNDVLIDSEGNDTLDGGDGNDFIYRYNYYVGGDDLVLGGAGADYLLSSYGNDTLDGGEGNDTLNGGSGDDVYLYDKGYGNDFIDNSVGFWDYEDPGNDILQFAAGISCNDISIRHGDADNLVVQIKGTGETVTIMDWFIDDNRKIKKFRFSDGMEMAVGQIEAMITNIASDYSDVLYAFGSGDMLFGQGGDDTLFGSDGNDWLDGGSGNDWLDSGSGNNVLNGGSGNDWLEGGSGDDVYVFGPGIGNDTISHYLYATNDIVQFAPGITANDISINRGDNSELVVQLKETGETLTFNRWFLNPECRVSTFQFADGTTITADQADAPIRMIQVGTDSGDWLYDYDGGSKLYGLAGNDTLIGCAANVLLDGGSGNDYLLSGSGNDIYVYAKGSGNDTISHYNGGNAVVQFGLDVLLHDIRVRRGNSNELVVMLDSTEETLTISNWFSDSSYRVAKFQFADGTELSADEVENLPGTAVIGSLGNDMLYGSLGNDTLDGGLGNDFLLDGWGNDIYLFGNGYGNDTISKNYSGNYAANDTVRLGADLTSQDIYTSRGNSNELIIRRKTSKETLTINNWFSDMNYRIAQLQFADGTVWSADQMENLPGLKLSGSIGNDTLFGTLASDTLDGGSGNDWLVGGSGNDIYVYCKGYGNDVINKAAYSGYNVNDVVQFGAGITAADLVMHRGNSNELIVSLNGTGETLTINNWFSGANYRTAKFIFADGSQLTASQVEPRLVLMPTNSNDVLYATPTINELSGLGGNDTLNGTAVNEVLDGGAGNDWMAGGNGNDIYIFGKGYGNDVISKDGYTPSVDDAIQFGAGITANDILIRRGSSNELIVALEASGETLAVNNWFSNPCYRIAKFIFADGTQFSADQVEHFPGMKLSGSTANDTLKGTIGNDTLDGMAGNDWLSGSYGNDMYIYGKGYGNDTIDQGGYTTQDSSVVQFDSSISGNDIELLSQDYYSDLTIRIKESREYLKINNWFGGNSNKISKFQFTDGTVITRDMIANVCGQLYLVNTGTGTDDNLQADFSMATLMDGSDGNDTILGNGGNDTLRGGSGNDQLYGGAGTDCLSDDNGANLFDGGAGDDVLQIGAGNDTIVYGRGYGNDVVSMSYAPISDNNDIIQLMPGITANDLMFIPINGGNIDFMLRVKDTKESICIYGSHCCNHDTKLVFADGSELTYDQIISLEKQENLGTACNDNLWFLQNSANQPLYLEGLAGNDILYGGQGNDMLYGDEENDLLDGAQGNDTLCGGIGNDTYLFYKGSGNDVIATLSSLSGQGNDTLRFGAGIFANSVRWIQDGTNLAIELSDTRESITINNWFSSNDPVNTFAFADGTVISSARVPNMIKLSAMGGVYNRVIGNGDNDTVQGGAGNDYLIGTGNDIFLFDRESGNDVISIPLVSGSSHGHGVVQFGEGISDRDIDWKQNGWSLVGHISGPDQTLTILNWFYDDRYKIDALRFADGSVIQADQVMEMTQVIGTYGNDYLVGSSLLNDKIDGLAGNDIVFGYDGDDTLSGGEDADQLHGGAGNDLLDAGTGNDSLYGYSGDDTLVGGLGEDLLQGGLGNDLYLYSNGLGNACIDNSVAQGLRGNDTVLLTDIAANEVLWQQNGENLVVNVIGSSQTLTVNNWFLDGNAEVDQFIFSENNVIMAYQATDLAVVQGGNGDDLLQGSNFHGDKIYGMDGNDTLLAYDGDDTLDGGIGNDYLTGGVGNDIYNYGKDSGSDIIDCATGNNRVGNDVIQFGIGIAASDIQWSHKQTTQGLQLISTFNNGETLTFINIYEQEDYGSVRLRFADGTELGVGDVDGLVKLSGSEMDEAIIAATSSDSELCGFAGSDSLYGNAGCDILRGGDGDDLLDGGAGNDYLFGGTGNDSYLYGISYGNDVIDAGVLDDAGNDIIQFGAGISANDILWQQSGENLTIILKSSNETLTLNNWFAEDSHKISKVYFADGSEMDASTITNLASLLGTETGDLMLASDAHDDKLYGGEGNDTLYGFGGNDLLDGGTGADWMCGGTGNDTYYVDDVNDVVFEDAGAGQDLIITSISYALSENVEELTLTGTTDISGTGNNLANIINGNSGNNTLDGGIGADTLVGGIGNDVYIVDNATDIIVEKVDEGIDEVDSSISYTLSDNVERLILTGNEDLSGTGNNIPNVVEGNSGNNLLTGGEGADTLLGGSGDDLYKIDNIGDVVVENADAGTDTVYASVSYILGTNTENLVLTGSDDINGTGNSLDNTLTGNYGVNILDGGDGNDILDGGSGADTYVIGFGEGNDTIRGAMDETDTVRFQGNWSALDIGISRNNDNLLFTDVSGQILTLENWYSTTSPLNYFVFANENITYKVVDGTLEQAEQPIIGNDLDNTLMGTENSEALYGLGGNDTLDGGLGNDTLIGGLGNDIYFVDHLGDEIVEQSNEGSDLVMSSVSYVLTENIENLTLTGTFDSNGIGNVLNNTIIGNNGTNILDGGLGADTLMGGSGNDAYIVDNINDVVVENLNEGLDLIQSSVSYTLGDNVENLALTGGVNLNGTGNALENSIVGNSGANVLDGSTGADTLIGNLGNDIYFVDNVGDSVIEKQNEGIDAVKADVNCTLAMNVENLLLLGTGDINGTGNALDNVIIGNTGANILDGGFGNDILIGGSGADVYNIGYGQGNDSIFSGDEDDSIHLYGEWHANDVVASKSGTNFVLQNTSGQSLVLTDWYTTEKPIHALTFDGDDESYTINSDIKGIFSALKSENGNDHYFINNVLDGKTVIEDNSGIDSLLFYKYKQDDFLFGQTGNDLVLSLKTDAGDQIVFKEWFAGNENQVEFIHFSDCLQNHIGVSASEITAIANRSRRGTDGSDTMVGSISNDFLFSLGGNDLLDGGTGNDWLAGGTGNDLLSGGAGNDQYWFDQGYGDDTIIANTSNSNDIIVFGSDIDPIDLAFNASGSNLVIGLAGDSLTVNNWFSGTTNQVNRMQFEVDGTVATYRVGNDSGNNLVGTVVSERIYGLGGNDTLDGGAGFDSIYGGAGNDRILYDANDVVLDGGSGNDTLDASKMQKSVVLSADDLLSIENLTGGTGSDTLTGDGLANILTGNGGNDILDGGAGNDILSGGAGNDQYWFDIGYGNDTIVANTSNSSDTIVFGSDIDPLDLAFSASGSNLVIGLAGDSLTVNNWFSGTTNQVNRMQFEVDGTVATYRIGNDSGNNLVGTALAERIYGLGGNDTMNGGAGADSIYGGDGNDRIVYDANDMVIDGGSGNDTLDASKMQQGLALSLVNFTSIENLAGGNGNDTLTGDEAANSLIGNNGNDILDGGAGNDILSGGAGSDQYWFDHGYGNDTIVANSYNSKDTIVFGSAVDPLELAFRVSGSNLVIGLGCESLTVNGWFSGTANQVNQMQFEVDGTVATYRIGNDSGNNIVGTALAERIYGLGGNDTLNGGEQGDLLYGGDGNDRLLGSNGNDTLDGGAGNDILDGGAGNDVYLFNADFGVDSIVSSSFNSNDCVEFGSQFTVENLLVSTTGNNLTITDGAGNVLTVENWGTGGDYAIDHYQIQGLWYNTNGHVWQLTNEGRLF